MRARIAFAAFSCVSFLPAAQAAVLVVDINGTPGTHPSVQDAINASGNGDLILVRPGDYTTKPQPNFPTLLFNQSLTIVADPPGASVTTHAFSIGSLASNQTVVIRGLGIVGSKGQFGLPTPSPGVAVHNCQGAVLLEDCTIEGGIGVPVFGTPAPGQAALRVGNATVTAVRCTLRGGDGNPQDPFGVPPGDGGPGALLWPGASVALFDCMLIGKSPATGKAGGAGARVEGGRMLISGSTLIGGDAQPGCATCAGGDGLFAFAGTQVRWIDSTFTPGSGVSALPIDAPPGVVSSWPGQARAWTLSSHAQEFQPVAVDIQGVQGDAVLFVWSPFGAHLPVGGLQAWLVVGAPLLGPFFLTTITSPDGHLAFNVNAPALVPATLDNFTFQMQPIFGNGGKSIAGAPSAFTLLR